MNGVELKPENVSTVVRENKDTFSKLVGKNIVSNIIKDPVNTFAGLDPHVKQYILNEVSQNA
jgi:hypothetical protein